MAAAPDAQLETAVPVDWHVRQPQKSGIRTVDMTEVAVRRVQHKGGHAGGIGGAIVSEHELVIGAFFKPFRGGLRIGQHEVHEPAVVRIQGIGHFAGDTDAAAGQFLNVERFCFNEIVTVGIAQTNHPIQPNRTIWPQSQAGHSAVVGPPFAQVLGEEMRFRRIG